MFQRILVANRGEIALRVIRAAREMGIESVAVFSEADRGAHYLSLADEAICIGPAAAGESYLKIDRIISAAEIGNVQAIHPGYGFLSENAHFAEVCRTSNIEFIGPPHAAMSKVGDKVSARELAIAAKVPVRCPHPTCYDQSCPPYASPEAPSASGPTPATDVPPEPAGPQVAPPPAPMVESASYKRAVWKE